MALAEDVAKPRNSHIWDRHPDDWYVEEPWCSERLFRAFPYFAKVIWDPACGMGRIPTAARGAGLVGVGSDKVRRCDEAEIHDFLSGEIAATVEIATGWGDEPFSIVTNPPFGLAERFIDISLRLLPAGGIGAFLLPARFMFGDKRSRWLETLPLFRTYHLTPRPSMPPGEVILAGEAPGGGKEDFIWLLAVKGGRYAGPEQHWLRKDP